MYVAVVPNRGSPPAILLRESYREAGKTKNRTLANLSGWPAERIEQLRAVLRGDKLLPAAAAWEIVRALPHGHVLAALGTARHIALDTVLPRRAPQRRRDLALALIVARLLEPAAKLATARMLDPATASHSLGEMLGLGRVTAKEVYAALDWLGREQPDPLTLAAQIDKLKQRFKLQRVVMVGDRGLLTSARVGPTLRPAGLGLVTAA